MTQKVSILDAGDTLVLSNLEKPWYLHCNEHNNVPITIPDRLLLCVCQLQGENKFLHESLVSCPSTDNIDRNVILQSIWPLFINYK